MKLGILIVTYNRPEYLKATFDSFTASDYKDFEADTTICIVDDCSRDERTKNLIREFAILHNARIVSNQHNEGVFNSLKKGFLILKEAGCDVFLNIDSDVIMKYNWLQQLMILQKRFPDEIVTGFNTTTNGRHPVKIQYTGYAIKQTIGGLNMLFNRLTLNLVIIPSLNTLHWDWKACKIAGAYNRKIIVKTPSVFQHIGFSSLLNHNDPDQADDYNN